MKTHKVDFTDEELYVIERMFDSAYTAMLNHLIALDKARIEINCFMDKEHPERAELLRRNSEQEKEVSKAYVLFHGISNTCEKIRLKK